jgi:site-specific recombinase XerD
VRSIVTGSRSFLRFLAAIGRCSPLLVDAVPSVARWRLASLPRYLPTSDVARLVDSCPSGKPSGIRDRAVLLLLARLGLRSSDVCALRLQDVDFSQATLRLTGKARVEELLPLPQDVGDAVLLYLERARPASNDRHLFLTGARGAAFASSGTVSCIVRGAARRAGVVPPCGAHRLRHSAAFRMLHEGASLEAIGAVLRHRSLDSTAIYAKVDVRTLRLIAQPWPEVTP